MNYKPLALDDHPATRPANEVNTIRRWDELFYTRLDIRPRVDSNDGAVFGPADNWKDVFFFRDADEATGWYRYDKPGYDWYLETAIEKLRKLSTSEQLLFDRAFVFDLRQAIRQKYQRGGSATCELPRCRNTRKAVDSWIKTTFDRWGDKLTD